MTVATAPGVGDDLQTIDTRFGTFTARPCDMVSLVDGLPGFEDCRQFFLLSSPLIAPLMCLQGVEGAQPAFLAIDPRMVAPDYACRLDDLQRQRLAASLTSPLLWLAIVRVAEDGAASVNLRAPLVINAERMRGLQLLAGHDRYHPSHPLE